MLLNVIYLIEPVWRDLKLRDSH